MNKLVSLDVFSCLDSMYKRMSSNYDFAFPNNNFSEGRAHQILCRFNVFDNHVKLILLLENIPSPDTLQSIYFKQVIANISVVEFFRNWTYPQNNIDHGRTKIALHCIESSLKNYRNAITLLGEHCVKDKTVDFDLIHFIKEISCSSYYNYAYPKNNYSEEAAHPAFQMLISLTDNVSDVLSSIKTNNPELNTIIVTMASKVKLLKDNLNKAYPNNNFKSSLGHQFLTEFINSWKSFKELSVTSLNSYFEKQALINQYEAKLNPNNVPSVESSVVNPIIEPIVETTTTSHKIKSLL